VLGTTGWGHRPFEDSAEVSWDRILYQDLSSASAVRTAQYAQLRRILVGGFQYWRRLAELRATRPATATFNSIPIRAFVTELARQTAADVTTPDGLPLWPFDPTLSVPYFADVAGSKKASIAAYLDDDDVVRTRALLERGSAASVAFLTAVGQLGAPYVPAAVCGSTGATFDECGSSGACSSGCCVADVSAASLCAQPCDHSACTGTYCPSTCSAGTTCDASDCCIPSVCPDDACESKSDCGTGFTCSSGCCDYVVR
jgi:hypothetical protein